MVAAASYLLATAGADHRDQVYRIYNLSHSKGYLRAAWALGNLSNILGSIQEVLSRLVPGASQQLPEILRAADYMEQIRVSSEKAKETLDSIESAQPALAAAAALSAAFIAAGALMIYRGRGPRG